MAHFCKAGLGAKKNSAPPAGIKPGKESWKGGAREKSASSIFFLWPPETRGGMWAHSRAPVWCAPAPHEEHAKQTSGLSRWVGTTCNVDGRFGLLLPKGTQDMPVAPENYQKKNRLKGRQLSNHRWLDNCRRAPLHPTIMCGEPRPNPKIG